jgi:hypothetical protein
MFPCNQVPYNVAVYLGLSNDQIHQCVLLEAHDDQPVSSMMEMAAQDLLLRNIFAYTLGQFHVGMKVNHDLDHLHCVPADGTVGMHFGQPSQHRSGKWASTIFLNDAES